MFVGKLFRYRQKTTWGSEVGWLHNGPITCFYSSVSKIYDFNYFVLKTDISKAIDNTTDLLESWNER